jgi:hypothetical protein
VSRPAETTGRRARGPAAPASLAEELRALHLEMVEAVLTGDGLEGVARLAARAAGAPVAIVVPRLDAAAASALVAGVDLGSLKRHVAARLAGGPGEVTGSVVFEVPIAAGDEALGIVLMLGGPEAQDAPEPPPELLEPLHLAALASLTEVAVEEARAEVEQDLRGSVIEELRARTELEPQEIVRRGSRLGSDLSKGAVALCAELTTERPRHVVALVTSDEPGALAQHLDGRVYALVPAGDRRSAPETLEAARHLASRLQRYGTVGVSSFYAEAGDLGRAIEEAELVLDVVRRSGGPIAEDIGEGTYRLLFRVLASHPEEVRSFYEDTVAPLVRYDEQYGTDLVGTLETYIAHNCNMNATAGAIFAHRHTVAYRLERVRELTGLDPTGSEDRERLSLGLKAHRIIAPRLPR